MVKPIVDIPNYAHGADGAVRLAVYEAKSNKSKTIITALVVAALLGLGLVLPAVLGGITHGANTGTALLDGWKKMGAFAVRVF